MIGLFGGTFDPVHHGHLRSALEVSEALSLEELRFIPSQIPPHRQTPGARPEQRLEMLAAALADAPENVMIDRRELDRPGPSYMVDTLASLRQEFPDTPLVLVLGLDAFLGLDRWHRWPTLFEFAHIAVMQRPGFSPMLTEPLAAAIAPRRVTEVQALRLAPAGRVHFLDVTQLEISASQIRDLIRLGRNPKYLIPEAVAALIQDLGLYRSRD